MKQQHTEVRFDGQDVYVGIDNAKKSWKIALFIGTDFYRRLSQPPKTEILVQYLRRQFPGARYHVVYEAGYFGFWIQREFTDLGVDCMVTNPADVPATNKERRGKNDHIDAHKLGRSYASGELHPIHIPERTSEEDRILTRTRMRFVRKQTRTKCQIKALLNQLGYQLADGASDRYWSRAYLAWLQQLTFARPSGKLAMDVLIQELLSLRQTIATLTKSIHRLAQEDRYRQRVVLLCSVPGIGILAAVNFLTEIIDLERFKTLDRLASFVGLIPDEHSSGEREEHTGITRRHNAVLRYFLIECAWKSLHDDPALLAAFKAYCVRMPPNVAIVHIARKLLNRMRFVLKNGAPYVSGVAA